MKTHHRVPLAAAAAGLLTACIAGQDVQIRIEGAHPLESEVTGGACTINTEVFQTAGSLDLAGAGYLIEFDIRNTLQEIEVKVGDDTLSDSTRNDFIGTQIVTRYQTLRTPPIVLEAEREPTHMVIKASGGVDYFSNIIGRKARTRLNDQVAPGDDPFDLLVSWRVEGRLASSGNITGSPVSTNEVTFPITIFKSALRPCLFPDGGFDTTSVAPCQVNGLTSCVGANDAGVVGFTLPLLSGPCGNIGGQDGAPLACF